MPSRRRRSNASARLPCSPCQTPPLAPPPPPVSAAVQARGRRGRGRRATPRSARPACLARERDAPRRSVRGNTPKKRDGKGSCSGKAERRLSR
eukprot:3501349-Pleurochrysis_carterae.AAC.4